MVCGPGRLRNSQGVERQLPQHQRCGVNKRRAKVHNTFGVDTSHAQWPQGSSFLATLGFDPESRWDIEPGTSTWLTYQRPGLDRGTRAYPGNRASELPIHRRCYVTIRGPKYTTSNHSIANQSRCKYITESRHTLARH